MKKGIMLPFIVTVVLALIIFIPLTLFASKLFRLSGQAEESFEKLTIDLNEFASDSNVNKIRSRVLIMDAKTFIAAFKEEGERVFLGRRSVGGQPLANPTGHDVPSEVEVSDYFEFPQDYCQGDSTCICLCQEFEVGVRNEDTISFPEEGDEIPYICKSLYCKNVEKVILAENFGVSRVNEGDPRRIQIKLEKISTGEISITKQ